MSVNEMKKSKKATVILWLSMLGLIIGVVTMLGLRAAYQPENRQAYIGETQLALLRSDASLAAEHLFVKEAAPFALSAAVFSLAQHGGVYDEPDCGSIGNVPVWAVLKSNKYCNPEPETAKEAYGTYVQDALGAYLKPLPDIPLRYVIETHTPQTPQDRIKSEIDNRIRDDERDDKIRDNGRHNKIRDDKIRDNGRDNKITRMRIIGKAAALRTKAVFIKEKRAPAAHLGRNLSFAAEAAYSFSDYETLGQEVKVLVQGVRACITAHQQPASPRLPAQLLSALPACVERWLREINNGPFLKEKRLSVHFGDCAYPAEVESDKLRREAGTGYVFCAVKEDGTAFLAYGTEEGIVEERPVEYWFGVEFG